MTTTTAAVLRATGAEQPYSGSNPLTLEELTLDAPGPGEVLVRVLAAGLCHSDLSVVDGSRPRPTPMALGHEGCVEVVQVGADVDDLASGDRAVVVFVPACGRCGPCADGRAALCEPGARANAVGELLGGGRRLHDADGAEVHHHLGASVFADHAVVSRRSLVPLRGPDAALDPAVAALFGCAVLTGVGAVVNTGDVRLGQTVAVVGLGGVGLAAVLGALAAGAAQVVGVDLREQARARAAALGAEVVDGASADAPERVRELTGGGADVAVDAAGAAAALDAAYRMTRRGGTTVTAGLAHPSQTVALQQVGLVAEERTVRGSYLGGGVPARDVPRLLALHRTGRLPVDRLLTGTGPLSGINTALDDLADGRTARHVLLP